MASVSFHSGGSSSPRRVSGICDPISIGVIVSLAATGASIDLQQQQSEAANEYEEAVYKQSRANAFETFAALQQRELQERASAAQDIRAVTSQARQAASAARLQAIESGASGPSIQALYSVFERRELENVENVRLNLSATQLALRERARAAGYVRGPAIQQGPLDTPLGATVAGLQVASAGLGTYGSIRPL